MITISEVINVLEKELEYTHDSTKPFVNSAKPFEAGHAMGYRAGVEHALMAVRSLANRREDA